MPEQPIHPDSQIAGAIISEHMAELQSLYVEGMRLTFLARDPAFPDASRDMIVSADDPAAVVRSINILASLRQPAGELRDLIERIDGIFGEMTAHVATAPAIQGWRSRAHHILAAAWQGRGDGPSGQPHAECNPGCHFETGYGTFHQHPCPNRALLVIYRGGERFTPPGVNSVSIDSFDNVATMPLSGLEMPELGGLTETPRVGLEPTTTRLTGEESGERGQRTEGTTGEEGSSRSRVNPDSAGLTGAGVSEVCQPQTPDALRRARTVIADMLHVIVSGRRVSIGALGNTYCPQIDVGRVDEWRNALVDADDAADAALCLIENVRAQLVASRAEIETLPRYERPQAMTPDWMVESPDGQWVSRSAVMAALERAGKAAR